MARQSANDKPCGASTGHQAATCHKVLHIEYELEFSSVGPSSWFTFEKYTVFMLRTAHF